jgi:transposase InsO family protein
MARDGVPVGPEFAAAVARYVRGEQFDVSAECVVLGCSRKTFYKYATRFRVEGVDGFYPRSRRPSTSPTQVTVAVEDLIVRGRKELDDAGWDAGAEQIRFWLAEPAPGRWSSLEHGQVLPSRSTINRVLERRGQIVRVPQRRPRRSRHRFEADQPNSLWQMDGFVHDLATGQSVVVLELSDDCSRYDLALRAARSENAVEVWAAVVWASSRYGLPARFLTDNGTAFSGARRGWVSPLEENLRALGVDPITSSVGHPQTCGKNERAHATVRKWLAKQPPVQTLEELQDQLDRYREHYNHRRRRTHLEGMTPAERYALGPHDGPGDQPTPWPVKITTATVSTSGCIGIDKHLLGVGRAHAGKTLTLIRQHRQITVFDTNEFLADYTLRGHRGYQPKNPPNNP